MERRKSKITQDQFEETKLAIENLSMEEKKIVTNLVLEIIKEQLALAIGNALITKLVWLAGLSLMGIFWWAVEHNILSIPSKV